MSLLSFLGQIGFHKTGSIASITLRPLLPPQKAQADEIAPATGKIVGFVILDGLFWWPGTGSVDRAIAFV
jgi:hypothetical protein